jgi:hypothetical protein
MKRLLLVLGAATALAVAPAAQTSTVRTVHISVTDDEGAPVSGLAPGDLTVVENGIARQIVNLTAGGDPVNVGLVMDDRAFLATRVRENLTAGGDPVNVGLVMDDRAFLATRVRESVKEFTRALAGKAAIGIFSYSRPEWTVLDFTRDQPAIEAAIDAMAVTPTTSNDPEGLMQTLARRFRKQAPTNSALVVLTFGAPNCVPRNCASSVTPRWDLVLDDLLRSGTTVHAIGTNPIEPAHLIYAAVEATGGTPERLLTDTAVSLAMQRTAERISSQQALTYTSVSAPRDGMKLRVTTARPGVHVHAPQKVF